ncbi:MAG TPA: hypothetical protein PLR83_00165 [Pyrinomonadaceae bacterium]|nr:hypothetical protein [Pyrinomonadaceae bacterium]
MFKISNISKYPIEANDGTYIVPGASCEVASVTKRHRDLEGRGWLVITNITENQITVPSPTQQQQAAGKKGGEK